MATGKFAQRGTRGISSLIFLASFILSAFLALGTLTTNRALGLRASLPGGQGLLQYYVSGEGLLTLVPLDCMLLIYTFFIILDIVTLRVLAEAQIAAEENPEHAQELAGKAEKYIDWALSGLVFFITVEFSSALSSLHILIVDNFWILLVISAKVAVIVRSIMHRITQV
jgi:hypothetical protein